MATGASTPLIRMRCFPSLDKVKAMSLTILSGIKPSLDVLMTLKYERYSAFMYPLVWCLGMVCVCLSGSVDAALSLGGKVSISPEFEGPVKLERVVSYYTDSDNSRVLDDFRNGDYRDQFVALEKSSHSLGYADHTYWLAFQLDYAAGSHPQPVEFYIKNNFSLLDEIDIYVIREHPNPATLAALQNPVRRAKLTPEQMDPYLEVIRLGEMRPFANNRFVFPRQIAGFTFTESEKAQVLIRVRSAGSKILQMTLESQKSILSFMLTEGGFLAAFYAVMAAMVLYNLFVFIAVREKAYFYYVVSIFTFLLAQFTLDGLPWAVQLFKDPFWVNQFLPLSICLAWVFMLTFFRSFLETKKYAPNADHALRILLLLYFYWCFLSPLVEYNIFIQVSAIATLFSCMMVSFVGAYIWSQGNTIAGYFMFAWMVYMAGASIIMFNTLGLMDSGWLGLHSSQLGSLGNVLLLSLALADNINSKKRRMERAIKESEKARYETQLANERAQINLQKFRQIWENAREGIFQCTLDGRFISANPMLASILGYESNQELVDSVMHIGDQLYADPAERIKFEQILAEQEQIEDFECLLQRKDGTQFWSSSSAHMIRDERGYPSYIEGTLVDISERVEKEKAQRDREAAEASTAAKSEFLANMSHEIRTPMNAIIGFTDLALRSELSPRQKDYLSKINTSSRNLLGIINDILDFSKIEAGRMELESTPFELDGVLDNILDLFADRVSQKGLEFSVHLRKGTQRRVVGDPLRLGQVLTNLVGNAVKFTSEGEICLTVEVVDVEPKGDSAPVQRLLFKVRDTGIGIPRNKIASLFSPFTQVDGSTTRKFGGTGLGLSICKQIVELMNGAISVTSELNKGSEFAFEVDVGLQAEQGNEIPAGGQLQHRHVLLVDDRDFGHSCLVEILEAAGCEVSTLIPEFNWEQQVTDSLKAMAFDLCLVDRNLHAVSTEQMIELVRLVNPDMPMIVGALMNEESLLAMVREGQHVALHKPVSDKRVYTACLRALGLMAPEADVALYSDNQQTSFPQLKGYSVLLVEDTFFNQQLAMEYLEDFGIVPDLAENGEEALRKLGLKHYDVVLMDCQMPVMDGYEATRRIRRIPRFEQLPVVAMTANAMKGDREKCLAAGMTDYLTKPIDPKLLYEALVTYLPERESPESAIVPESGSGLSLVAVEDVLNAFDSGNVALCSQQVKALAQNASLEGATELVRTFNEISDALQYSGGAVEPLLYRAENQIQAYLNAKENG